MQPPTFWNPVHSASAALAHWRRSAWKRRHSCDSGDDVSLLSAPSQAPQDAQRRWQLLARSVVAGAAVLLALYVLAQLPIKSYMISTSAWIRAHSVLGTVVAILLFWIAIPLCVPSTILEAIAGSLFGVWHGVLVILIGKTVGSWLTFLLGRRLGKAVLGDYLSRTFPTFRALSEVLNGDSWKPLVLFQLASIPNLFKCYGLAITEVSGWRFAVSSAVGSTPHAFLWANIGTQASDIAAIVAGQSEMTSSKLAVLVGGAALTVLAMGTLVVYTKRELAELQKREYASGSEEESSPITIAITMSPREYSHARARTGTHGGDEASFHMAT